MGALIDKAAGMVRPVTFTPNVTLIGAGEVSETALSRALSHAPVLVAADGGADRALELGRVPDWVIGDMDSIGAAADALPPDRLIAARGQDDTDFDKALAFVDAALVLAVGFTGGRLDHTLAAMNTLARNPHRRVLIDAGEDLCFHAPPELSLTLPPASRLSLFPMTQVQAGSSGLKWATEGLGMAPHGRIGTSNAVTDGPVTLRPAAPGLLVLLPIAAWEAAIAALSAAPLWPAPARAR